MKSIEPAYKDFGLLVIHGRKSKKLTQEQLAALVGFSRVSIANIEAGRQRVFLHNAIELCTILGIKQNFLSPKVLLEAKKSMAAVKKNKIIELQRQLRRLEGAQ